MSFHNARVVRGDLANKQIESHAGYTRGGGLCGKREQSEHLAGVSITGGIQRWIGGRGPQARRPRWQHESGRMEVWQGSESDPWYSQARVLGGQRAEFSQPPSGGSHGHIDVRTESLSTCPICDLGISGPSKGSSYHTPAPQS